MDIYLGLCHYRQHFLSCGYCASYWSPSACARLWLLWCALVVKRRQQGERGLRSLNAFWLTCIFGFKFQLQLLTLSVPTKAAKAVVFTFMFDCAFAWKEGDIRAFNEHMDAPFYLYLLIFLPLRAFCAVCVESGRIGTMSHELLLHNHPAGCQRSSWIMHIRDGSDVAKVLFPLRSLVCVGLISQQHLKTKESHKCRHHKALAQRKSWNFLFKLMFSYKENQINIFDNWIIRQFSSRNAKYLALACSSYSLNSWQFVTWNDLFEHF